MNVKILKPYGLVKSFGDFIVISDVNSKVPLQNFACIVAIHARSQKSDFPLYM